MEGLDTLVMAGVAISEQVQVKLLMDPFVLFYNQVGLVAKSTFSVDLAVQCMHL